MDADEAGAATLRRRFAEHEPVEVEHSGLTMRALHAFLPSSDLLHPDATAGPAAVPKDEQALMEACHSESTKSRRRAAKLAKRRERAEQKAEKRAQQAQEMGQYDHGGYLLRVIASKAKPDRVVERQSKLKRPELLRYASRVMKLEDLEGESFMQRLNRLFTEAGGMLPSITIEYRDMQIEADALVGTASVPSLTQSFWGFLKDLLRITEMRTTPLRTLSVSGKLNPGRLTLLMGPPQSGKSLFMHMLAGRLHRSKFLRVKGSVLYNGRHAKEFNMARAIAMVDQIDEHIPILTVRESLEFAHICQNGFGGLEFNLVEEMQRLRGESRDLQAQLLQAHVQHQAALRALEEHVSMTTEPESNAPENFEDSSTDISSMPSTPAHSLQTGALRSQLSQAPSEPPEKNNDDEFEELLAKVWGTGVRMEILMRVMGLARVADTKVGNALVRGVSGGERKRVTSAEMLVGPKKVLLMDEISTGLDSATTYTVVQYLRNATHHMHLTTLVSLLQPAPEVYNLFDDVLLLTDGQLMFHGPVSEALPFFASLGFECPVRKDPASFLQEVTTPKGQLLYASEKLRAERGLDRKGKEALGNGRLLVGCAEISAAFWDTPWGRAMRDELDNKPFRPEDGHPSALPRKAFALTWWQAVGVLLNRQWKLTVRDSALVRGRIIQVVVMALIIGSLFSGQRPTASAARNYFGVSFLSMMFLSMGAMPEMGITFANKPVTFKQRDNRFFPPSAYALALLLVRIPFQLVEAALFTLVVYFWVGFHAAVSTFFIFYLICIATMLQMSAVYRLLASASPNTDIGTAAGGVVLLVLIVTSGFAIIRTAIPPWWIWAYWISPFAYGLRAIVVNEMTSAGWSYSDANTPPGSTVGIQALESFGFQTEQMWIWIGVGYNVGLALLLTILSGVALQYCNPVKMRPTTAADESAAKSAAVSAEIRKKRTERLIKSSRFRKVHASTDASVDVEKAMGADGAAEMVSSLPFTPITLVYRDLQYFVPLPGKKQVGEDGKRKRLELLKPMSGAAVPGQLTALMGGSGAGKTTLMDVIAGRKTQGEIKGEILVNGFPKEQKSWARVVGYVEQNDIHTPQVVVREALEFSARLRISESASHKQIEEYVDEVLDIVELTPLKDSLVGIPGTSGLSVEQRKRLTIAVELVANPSVIFMDEPTSGLDARAAAIVMQSVKNVSKNGRTVMVTIHQPSIDIFEAFDALVLLQRGGKLIYSGPLGPESSALIAYLEAVPGVHPISAGENPATWMLEVTGGASITGKSKAASVDFAEYYKTSELHEQNEALIEELAGQGKQQGSRLSLKGTYATKRGTQFVALARKYRLSYWRSPSYNLTRMLMTLLICLFYGTMFWGRGRLPKDGANIGNIQNVMGVLYSATNFQGMFNLMNVLPIVGFERGVFYRERAALMYAHLPYISAVAFVELPYLLAQVLVFVPISYFMIGFKLTASAFFYFFFMFLLDLALFTYFGQFLVFLTPSQGLAQIIASAVQTLWSIFNGFMLPYPLMPMGWKWLNRISPATWIIYGLAVDQMGENTDKLITPEGQVTTVKDFLASYFGYEYSFRWNCTAIIIAYIFLFRIGSMLSVRFVSYQRR